MELEEEKIFVDRCNKDLPRMLMVDGIRYKMHANGLLSGGFRISYGEFDGDFFNWKNKPIDLLYRIDKYIPEPLLYKEDDIKDLTTYVTSLDDVINHCSNKLIQWHNGNYEELDEIVTKETQFHRDLTSLLNKNCKENGSDTPDFILASYLLQCMRTLDNTINAREKWYGRKK